MQEASVQGFLRTILIIILVYYALKLIGRIVFPMLFKRVVGKFEEKVKNQQQHQTNTSSHRVGETVIDKKPQSNKESNKDVGEYVDYEEVD